MKPGASTCKLFDRKQWWENSQTRRGVKNEKNTNSILLHSLRHLQSGEDGDSLLLFLWAGEYSPNQEGVSDSTWKIAAMRKFMIVGFQISTHIWLTVATFFAVYTDGGRWWQFDYPSVDWGVQSKPGGSQWLNWKKQWWESLWVGGFKHQNISNLLLPC